MNMGGKVSVRKMANLKRLPQKGKCLIGLKMKGDSLFGFLGIDPILMSPHKRECQGFGVEERKTKDKFATGIDPQPEAAGIEASVKNNFLFLTNVSIHVYHYSTVKRRMQNDWIYN